MTIPGVFILGVALLVAGWLTGIWILWILGIVCLVAVLFMWLMIAVGHPIGGRRY